jgi:type VI secretion system secreted protein Hcp
MVLNALLKLSGQIQGQIQGPVNLRGREGSIWVYSYNNEIISPRDPESGLPSGIRGHKSVVITKEIDKASPLLWKAFVKNETLTTWELRFWEASTEKQIYTISLTNATIASIREIMTGNEGPSSAKRSLYEEISFTYEKITWMWIEGGVAADDDWPKF